MLVFMLIRHSAKSWTFRYRGRDYTLQSTPILLFKKFVIVIMAWREFFFFKYETKLIIFLNLLEIIFLLVRLICILYPNLFPHNLPSSLRLKKTNSVCTKEGIRRMERTLSVNLYPPWSVPTISRILFRNAQSYQRSAILMIHFRINVNLNQ